GLGTTNRSLEPGPKFPLPGIARFAFPRFNFSRAYARIFAGTESEWMELGRIRKPLNGRRKRRTTEFVGSRIAYDR
ncbi:MAG: hypothetical protein OXN84_20610, partial [Albidovulum sp.]|nr:hypothetical protein [Albidovulum sp.]